MLLIEDVTVHGDILHFVLGLTFLGNTWCVTVGFGGLYSLLSKFSSDTYSS